MNSFFALSDATRRAIMNLLAMSGQLPASRIAERFNMTAPAISQHLKILRDANLLIMQKHGQQRLYSLNRSGIDALETWLKGLREPAAEKLDDLEIMLLVASQTPASLDEDEEDEFA